MTSLNWKITASVGEGAVFIIEAGNPGFPIVTTDTPERAVFVHRACEAHGQLVAALWEQVRYVTTFLERDGADQETKDYYVENARAALAAAGAP